MNILRTLLNKPFRNVRTSLENYQGEIIRGVRNPHNLPQKMIFSICLED